MPGPDVSASDAALLPSFDSLDAFRAGVATPGLWDRAVALACERAGIEASEIHGVSRRDTPTFFVGTAHVLKLYGTWARGHDRADAEVAALRLMARVPSLPVPALVDHGGLEGSDQDGWRYLVMTRVPGATDLRTVRDSLDVTQRRVVVRWLGRTVAAIRSIPLEDAEIEDGRQRFTRMVRQHHARAQASIIARGRLPSHLAATIDAWLPQPDELLAGDWPIVLLHNDLKYGHIRGDVDAAGFEPRGLVDFNRSFPGHPLWELGYLWRGLIREPRATWRAFLEAAEIPGRHDEGFGRRLLAWWLIIGGDQFVSTERYGGVTSLDELAADWFG